MTKKRANPGESEEPVGASAKEARPEAEPIPDLSPSTVEDRMAVVEGEKAEIYDRMLRIAADFDNWKKRAQRELADAELHTKASVLRDFLEIADSLERAILFAADGKESDAKSVRDGVELVLRQFRSKLGRYDVKPIETAGVPFDPRLHEAVSQAPSATETRGTVLHELKKGYLIGEKLLRPAMVVVAAQSSGSVAARKVGSS